MEPIYVTRTFLPPFDEVCELLRQMWDTHLVTNDGPFYRQFENELREYTHEEHLACVGNGTLALQIALRALGIIGKDVITTPFTHVSTSNCLVWEQCTTGYADIDPETLNIDPGRIEAKITARTAAILAVHVYSNPCDVERIAEIANHHGLKVIYDERTPSAYVQGAIDLQLWGSLHGKLQCDQGTAYGRGRSVFRQRCGDDSPDQKAGVFWYG